jgi:hypothetical protein
MIAGSNTGEGCRAPTLPGDNPAARQSRET